MSFRIDTRQVSNWAARLKASPQRLDTEMVSTMNSLAGRGVKYVVGNAPYKDGYLVGKVRITKTAGRGDWHAAYGVVGVEYAWMREKGGTIRARNKPYLHFRVNGQWVKVKSVRQKGTHYVRRAHRRLWPEAVLAIEGAVTRAMEMR